ncbi:tetratricopeptide repeat protein [Vreelandella venusta]|uniref:tetratricopeptide repeat protein n=1 Tax=Vreelandella venusta TaxID=44935 RepID=UPI00200EDA8B|nr:hypothetical protein [Halomonas venusta]UQI42761.1 hypothetical protein M3L73_11045 [Halomonas venusta]
MRPVPITADQPIVAELQRKRFSEDSVSDLEMQAYLNRAYALNSNTLEGAFAVAYVYSFWRKFSKAENHTDALVNGWPETPRALYFAVICYGMTCCYTKCLSAAQKLVSIEPGNPRSANMLSYASLLSGAISEYQRARDLMKFIGVPEAEIPKIENTEEIIFLSENHINEGDVVRYYQLHLEAAKPFLNSNQHVHLGTNIELYTDPESGIQEFWINLVASTDGVTASRIDWEFSKQDFPGFSEEFKEKVWVGLTLAPDSGIEHLRMGG